MTKRGPGFRTRGARARGLTIKGRGSDHRSNRGAGAGREGGTGTDTAVDRHESYPVASVDPLPGEGVAIAARINSGRCSTFCFSLNLLCIADFN